MSDDMSEVGGETEGVPMSSASSISNDFASELPNVMSETEDSNSYLEPSSSETDSFHERGDEKFQTAHTGTGAELRLTGRDFKSCRKTLQT